MTDPAEADPPPLPECVTWTVTEAAALLGCSPHHYSNLVRRGEVPGRRLGRRIVIPKLQLARYLAGEDWA